MLEKFRKGKQEEKTKATDRTAYLKGSVPAWKTAGTSMQRSNNYTALMERFNGWIYAACMVNARGVASQTIKLYSKRPQNGAKSITETKKVDSQKCAYLQGRMESKPSTFVQRKAMNGDLVEVFSHPVLDLLDNPSPEMDGYTLAVQRMLNLQLTGNAYLHPIVSDTIGVPVELWNMQSNLVTIIPDGELDLVASYTYGQQPSVVEFRKDEVLHEKQPNPSDPFYGKGWVSSCVQAADLLQSMDNYEQNVLDNQARPDWAVMVKEHLTDGQYQRLMQQIERQLGGKNNRSRPFIFEGGTSGVPMSFSPNDLAFDSGEARKIEVIAAIAGVPVSKLKANDPNLANAREGNLGWLRDTIVPYLTLDEAFLNRQLLPMFGIFADDLFLAYDDPVAADRSAQATVDASDAASGIRTRNEIRAERGLEPVQGGDELLVPAGSVPIDVAIDMARNPQPMGMPFGALAQQPQTVQPRIGVEQPPKKPRKPNNGGDGDGNGDEVGYYDDSAHAPEPENGTCPTGWHYMPADERHEKPWCMHGNLHPITADSMSKANGCVSEKINKLMGEGYPRNQAIAIAYSMCGLSAPDLEEKTHKDCGCNKELVTNSKSLWERSRSLISEKRAPVDLNNAEFEQVTDSTKKPTDRFRSRLIDVFRTQLENFLDTGMANAALWDGDSTSELENASREFVKEIMGSSGRSELERLVPDMELDFNFLSPNIANALEDYTAQLSTTLMDGTQRELDRKIATGVRNGLSTDEISDSIYGLLEKEPRTGIIPIEARAEMIARTEVAMIHEEGKLQAWKESGVVKFKQWLVSAGACDSCRKMAVLRPNPIPLDEPFAKAGQQVGKITVWRTMQTAPLHPNCRCGTIEVIGDESENEAQFIKDQLKT